MMVESFFFNDTATTEIYTLSLHDALPIYRPGRGRRRLRGVPLQHALRPVPARFREPHGGGVPGAGSGPAGAASGGDVRARAGEPGAQLPPFAAVRRALVVPVPIRAGGAGGTAADARRVRVRR